MRVGALTPTTGVLGVFGVGHLLYVVDAGQGANLHGLLRKQKCVPRSLEELEHAGVGIDASQSRVEVLGFNRLASSRSPLGWLLTAAHFHPLLY